LYDSSRVISGKLAYLEVMAEGLESCPVASSPFSCWTIVERELVMAETGKKEEVRSRGND
jgi:hypothetical protein